MRSAIKEIVRPRNAALPPPIASVTEEFHTASLILLGARSTMVIRLDTGRLDFTPPHEGVSVISSPHLWSLACEYSKPDRNWIVTLALREPKSSKERKIEVGSFAFDNKRRGNWAVYNWVKRVMHYRKNMLRDNPAPRF